MKDEIEQVVKNAYEYVDKNDSPSGVLSEAHIWNLLRVIELKDEEITKLKQIK